MIKRFKSVFKVLLFIVSLSLVFYTLKVKADSGFDSSWDSGGSWDSGSSWDSDYGSGSGGSGSPIIVFIFLTFFYYLLFRILTDNMKDKNGEKYANNLFRLLFYGRIVILIPLYFITDFIIIFDMIGVFILSFVLGGKGNKYNNQRMIQNINYDKLTEEQILNNIPALNIKEFYEASFNIYKEVQLAWMDNEIERVRNILSDEMFNTYKMQLETLKVKNQKNVMEDIVLKDVNIVNIQHKDNKEVIDVIMNVTCKDYLIDINTNKVLRGNKNKVWEYQYKLSYMRSISIKKMDYCPNCGASLKEGSSVKCEYCGAIINRETNKFILIDKKMLSQK